MREQSPYMDWKILPVLFSICYHAFSGPLSSSNENAGEKSSNDLVGKGPLDSEICLTQGCIVAASELIQSIDQTVDPCTDFYQFACGRFIAETVIPDHLTSTGTTSLVWDKLYERLRQIYEAESQATEPSIYEHVRNFYHSCMDVETIEKDSVNDLKEIVGKIGGWPVLEGGKWNGENFKWYELDLKDSDEGFPTNFMMSIGIETNQKDSLKKIIYIGQPGLGLSREYLIKGFNDKVVQSYYNYMVQTAVFLGANQDLATKEMKEVLEVELQLAEMSLAAEDMRNMTALYNPMTLGEVQKLYPELPLIKYISGSLGVIVDENEVVNVPVPKFITDFRSFISAVPARVQANYIVWRNVQSLMSYLDANALKINSAYIKVLLGQAKETPRWEKCISSTNEWLPLAAGSMYARKYFRLDTADVVEQMVKNVRAEFKTMLDELDWMDPKTKARAHQKADQITSLVAFPKEFLDDKIINEFYENMNLQKDSYLKNILRMRSFNSEAYGKEFREPVEKKSWKRHGFITEFHAYYSQDENLININEAILDGVFFNADRPQYMNYGAIGHVVGHEITHGFDDRGSQYDGDGNLVDWWEPESKRRYLEKAQCLIDQYGNYTVEVDGETLNLNGVNTQGENIADNGGIKEMFGAYERVVSKSGPEPILPGLQFTQRQLMWLSSARVWCRAQRPAQVRHRVLTDPHSPPQARVNVVFSNMPDFAQDWGCPAEAKMNPRKRCSVW